MLLVWHRRGDARGRLATYSGHADLPAQWRTPGAGSGTAGLTRLPLRPLRRFVDEFDIVMLRSEKLEAIEDRPRRGRPPKRPR